ncbi:DUF305 domain-containing protein [Actinokineospora soli]|uniref:DUF305 domain-containing protein n=1 Tax=Actinokineospora soli TaxID=1048753 RepID=A0ABW2TTE1_9PSEU
MNIAKTAVAAVAAGAALLAGCSTSDDGHDMGAMGTTTAPPSATPTAVAGEHNDADISFAQDMIPHHAQAIEMAELVDGRTTTPAVVGLAERVEKAQDPEIRTMTGWLTAWGAEVPESGGHGGHDSMPGMMSGEDMDRLAEAQGGAFDRLWLEMMIEHHEGAIEMARTELAEGANPGAKELAQQIIDGQQAEITEMKALLNKA